MLGLLQLLLATAPAPCLLLPTAAVCCYPLCLLLPLPTAAYCCNNDKYELRQPLLSYAVLCYSCSRVIEAFILSCSTSIATWHGIVQYAAQ